MFSFHSQAAREKKHHRLARFRVRIISLVRGIRTVKHNGLPRKRARNAARTRPHKIPHDDRRSLGRAPPQTRRRAHSLFISIFRRLGTTGYGRFRSQIRIPPKRPNTVSVGRCVTAVRVHCVHLLLYTYTSCWAFVLFSNVIIITVKVPICTGGYLVVYLVLVNGNCMLKRPVPAGLEKKIVYESRSYKYEIRFVLIRLYIYINIHRIMRGF